MQTLILTVLVLAMIGLVIGLALDGLSFVLGVIGMAASLIIGVSFAILGALRALWHNLGGMKRRRGVEP